jgi:hypothetical protein
MSLDLTILSPLNVGAKICVLRHRELREGLRRRARKRVEHVALAGVVEDVVEERAELGAGQFHARIRHDLDQTLEIRFDGESGTGPVEDFEGSPFFADIVLGPPLSGAVAQDLDEADDARRLTDGGDFAHRPELAAVLSKPPALLAAAVALRGGGGHFVAQQTPLPVLGREEPVQGFAQHFGLRPSENAGGARIPAGDAALVVGADDGGIGGAVDDLAPLRGGDGRRAQIGTFQFIRRVNK